MHLFRFRASEIEEHRQKPHGIQRLFFFFNIIWSSSRWIGSFCTVLLRHKNISVLLREAPQTEKYRATHKAGASCLGATTSHCVAFTAEPQAVFLWLVHVTNPPTIGHYTRNQVCVILYAWLVYLTNTHIRNDTSRSGK